MKQESLWGEIERQRDSRSPRPDDEVRAARLQRAIRAYGVTPEMLRHVADGVIREDAVWGLHAQALTPELEGLRRLVAGLFRPAVGKRISSPTEAAIWLLAETGGAVQESIWTVGLSTKHTVVCLACIASGTLSASPIRIAEIFRPALRANASSVIVAHNHPSGDPTPSPEDLAVMREIGEAGALLDCDLMDFIILGQGRWKSMRECSVSSATRWWNR